MRKYAQRCAYMRAYFAHICAHSMRIYARIFNFFLADTDAYLADGYRRYARIFGMRGNPSPELTLIELTPGQLRVDSKSTLTEILKLI